MTKKCWMSDVMFFIRRLWGYSMEILFKICVKIRIMTKKILWKIEYGNLLKFGTKFTFRNNVSLRSVGGGNRNREQCVLQ